MTRPQTARSPRPRVRRTRRRRIVALTVLLATALQSGLGACGGASTPSRPASVATSNAPAQTPALPTAAQLKAALLTAADLGAGFSSSTSTDNTGTTFSGCPALETLLNASPSAGQTSQEADYTAGDTGPEVGETLMTEPAAALDADYSQAETALTTCTALSVTSAGVSLDFTLTPIQFGAAGSAAVRMDTTYQGIQANGYLAVQRLGSVVLEFFYFQIASASSQTAYLYYTQAVVKARTVLGTAAT